MSWYNPHWQHSYSQYDPYTPTYTHWQTPYSTYRRDEQHHSNQQYYPREDYYPSTSRLPSHYSTEDASEPPRGFKRRREDYHHDHYQYHSGHSFNHSDMDTAEQRLDEFGRERRRSQSPPRSDSRSLLAEGAPISPRPNKSRTIPYRPHDNRRVTPPPQQTPSPSYLSIASQDPQPLATDDISLSRKLLILDLNGTLLHRAAPPALPRNRNKYPVGNAQPTPSGDQGAPSVESNEKPVIERPTDQSGRPLPRLRPVHPRPYMPAFRSYLFAPETRKWLDVMIWSSAQPHSVNDMVGKAFGDTQEGLMAVWARDTLGLSDEHYARKVQTFKDLTKPWAELPALLHPSITAVFASSPSPSSRSTPNSSPRPPPSSLPLAPSSPPSSPSLKSTGVDHKGSIHSALTTLLLDDSPRKAELQPYNHVCIPEYDGVRRTKDLQALQNEKALKELESHVQDEPREATEQECTQDQTEDTALVDAGDKEEVDDNAPASDEAGTKKRKRRDKKAKKAAAALVASVTKSGREDTFDQILLAVVGVLDEVRSQGNVAAWIRSGGLSVSHSVDSNERIKSPLDNMSTTAAPDLTVDGDDRPENKRMKGSESPAAVTNAEPTGNDAVTSSVPGTDTVANTGGTAPKLNDDAPLPMWFESVGTVRYWASRGRRVLEAMEIPVVHGIER